MRALALATLILTATLPLTGCDHTPNPQPSVSSETTTRTSSAQPSVPATPQVTSDTVRLTTSQFGRLWPFTTPYVTARCEHDDRLIITTPDGTKYGFNGHARDAGYPAPDPIRNTQSTGAVFSTALQTCSHR